MGRPGAAVSTPAQVLALRRVAGNATVSSVVEAGRTTVQRAAAGDAPAEAAPRHRFAASMPANPGLWSDFDGHYFTGGRAPRDGTHWVWIEQYCAYLAAHWLTHGHGSSGLAFGELDRAERAGAADLVVQWASGGGRDAQTAYAERVLGGTVVSREELTASPAELPVGTRIWFGNDSHAEAAYVAEPDVFLMYDPNTGRVVRRDGAGFARYVQNKNVFVRG